MSFLAQDIMQRRQRAPRAPKPAPPIPEFAKAIEKEVKAWLPGSLVNPWRLSRVHWRSVLAIVDVLDGLCSRRVLRRWKWGLYEVQ